MKKIVTLALTVCLALCMTACADGGVNHAGLKDYTNTTDDRFMVVPMQTDLYYDINTKIVYVIFNEYTGSSGYGYMSPYYADNGKPYKYNVEKNCLEEIQ